MGKIGENIGIINGKKRKMTNKEFAIQKVEEVISGLTHILNMLKNDENPQNEEWTSCAKPLNEALNILGNYETYKNKEYCGRFPRKKSGD